MNLYIILQYIFPPNALRKVHVYSMKACLNYLLIISLVTRLYLQTLNTLLQPGHLLLQMQNRTITVLTPKHLTFFSKIEEDMDEAGDVTYTAVCAELLLLLFEVLIHGN